MKSAIITTSCVVGAFAGKTTDFRNVDGVMPDMTGMPGMGPEPAKAPASHTTRPASPAAGRSSSDAHVKEHKPQEAGAPAANDKPTAAEAVVNIKDMDSKAIAAKVMKVDKLEQPFSMTQYQENDDGRVPVEVSATCDPYAVLLLDNVSGEITEQEVKTAYKALALKLHPDRNEDNAEAAADAMKRVSEAKDILCDEEVRAKYDSWKAEQVNERSAQREFMRDFNFGHGGMPRYGRSHMGVPHVYVVRPAPRFYGSSLGSLFDMLHGFSSLDRMFGMSPMSFGMPFSSGPRMNHLDSLLRQDCYGSEFEEFAGRIGAYKPAMPMAGFPTDGHVHMSSYSSSSKIEDGKRIDTITKIENGKKTVEKKVYDAKTNELILEEPEKEAIEQETPSKAVEEQVEEPVNGMKYDSETRDLNISLD